MNRKENRKKEKTWKREFFSFFAAERHLYRFK